uniref:Protein impA n=2 Tax=Desulfobacterium TaxID=2295 RepID=E1Y9B2_9BACT|nr:Protein impA [uncultured Desulfobacterium sp.]
MRTENIFFVRKMELTSMYHQSQALKFDIPLFLSYIQAGFPSPADDYKEKSLDLNEHLIKHPAATFFVKIKDDSMIKAGIFHGDLLMVDRSLKPCDKKVVIALHEGGMLVRRFRKIKGKIYLMSESPEYRHVEVSEDMNIEILGVATTVIHPV